MTQNRIKELPKHREAELPAIRDKWIAIGLQTGPGSLKDAWAGIRKAYTTAGRKEPSLWVWLESPYRAVYGCAVLAQVSAQVSAQVRAFANFYWWYPGQFDGYWLSYYEALREYCEFDKLDGLAQVAMNCAFAWTFPDVVVFSAPPTEIHRNAAGQLHCETGPAIKFADGWGVWALNGVRVTHEIVEMPAGELDPKLVLTTQNAEWRREIVRKIGIERVCESLNAKCIDKSGEYELLILDLGDNRARPFLKMRNPSIKVFHIEGVHPDCATVQQALNFRNGLTPAMIDDENGADWIQQGDVLLFPRGETKFKSRPIQLT